MQIPTVEAALASPSDFELTRSILGWSLSYLGEDAALLVSREDASLILDAMEAQDEAAQSHEVD